MRRDTTSTSTVLVLFPVICVITSYFRIFLPLPHTADITVMTIRPSPDGPRALSLAVEGAFACAASERYLSSSYHFVF